MAPRAAKSMARHRPMPFDAPVIKTTWFSNVIYMRLFSVIEKLGILPGLP
jgi:hypothetical protein